MSRFGPDPLTFFEAVYREPAPWDIGEPQPAMVALLAEYPPEGPVLDVGCGSGDLAIHVAEQGLPALGVDFVEEAIAQARAKRDALPGDVAGRLDFRVSDALRPSLLGLAFGAVVDSGFYHLFDSVESDRFVDDLARALRPGGSTSMNSPWSSRFRTSRVRLLRRRCGSGSPRSGGGGC